jgi:Cu(I)/Ag(I) efflux system membrane protein CusA/SilA
LSEKVKKALEGIPGVKDLYVDPITGGKYLTIDINRDALGRYGLTVNDVNLVIESAIGGTPIGQTIEGRQRFSISVRLAQDYRNSLEQLKRIPIKSPALGMVPLSSVATIRYEDGPPMITSENAMLRGAVLFNVRDRDLGSTVQEAIAQLNHQMGVLPNGMERAVRESYPRQANADDHLAGGIANNLHLPLPRL